MKRVITTFFVLLAMCVYMTSQSFACSTYDAVYEPTGKTIGEYSYQMRIKPNLDEFYSSKFLIDTYSKEKNY